jgi:asparagine synthase (glutamine-hydrolysing)
MADVQRHRGPDDSGTWQDQSGRIALSHCRLKVIDLSDAGHQPMASPSERFTIVFNGEIYNHRELKAELDRLGPQHWRGHSDTEILVAAFDHWGIRSTLARCTGMFAMAVWDGLERTLTLARDRMGEKPLHYGWCGGTFVFASEQKAFRAFPRFDTSIDTDALARYLWFGYVPAPHSIYKSVRKLMPGTILTVDEQGKTSEHTYWSLDAALHQPRFAGSPQEAAEEVARLLDRAVRSQCAADVPVGAFLSGGIDSSVIVALMRNATSRVKTFSIGFAEDAFNEAPHAASIARHLGTEHEEMVVTAQDALALIPRLAHIWDEPMGDSSQIPTALLSILARRQVTVSLSGDGGDELFLGYPWYRRAERAERIPAKRAIAAALKLAAPVAPVDLRCRLLNLGHRLTLASAQERHLSTMAGWDGEPSLVAGSNAGPPLPGAISGTESGRSTLPSRGSRRRWGGGDRRCHSRMPCAARRPGRRRRGRSR